MKFLLGQRLFNKIFLCNLNYSVSKNNQENKINKIKEKKWIKYNKINFI